MCFGGHRMAVHMCLMTHWPDVQTINASHYRYLCLMGACDVHSYKGHPCQLMSTLRKCSRMCPVTSWAAFEIYLNCARSYATSVRCHSLNGDCFFFGRSFKLFHLNSSPLSIGVSCSLLLSLSLSLTFNSRQIVCLAKTFVFPN